MKPTFTFDRDILRVSAAGALRQADLEDPYLSYAFLKLCFSCDHCNRTIEPLETSSEIGSREYCVALVRVAKGEGWEITSHQVGRDLSFEVKCPDCVGGGV